MKKIEAIIKPFKLDEVKEALQEVGLQGIPSPKPRVRPPEGPHRALSRRRIRGRLPPKVKVEVVLPDEPSSARSRRSATPPRPAASATARSSIVEEAIRIRTGERPRRHRHSFPVTSGGRPNHPQAIDQRGNMSTASEVLKSIKDNDVKYRGPAVHRSARQDAARHDGRLHRRRGHVRRRHGVRRVLHRRLEGDQRVRHDADARSRDGDDRPFFAQPTLAIFCDVLDRPGRAHNRDPRTTAKKALAYLQSLGIGDTVYFGPEAEFFIFDDVRFSTDPYNTGFVLDSSELPINTGVNTRAATSATVCATRAATSPSRRSIRRRICAPTC